MVLFQIFVVCGNYYCSTAQSTTLVPSAGISFKESMAEEAATIAQEVMIELMCGGVVLREFLDGRGTRQEEG